MTIHAGEWGFDDEFKTVPNLSLAAKYADRVGHALTLIQDENLLKQFAE